MSSGFSLDRSSPSKLTQRGGAVNFYVKPATAARKFVREENDSTDALNNPMQRPAGGCEGVDTLGDCGVFDEGRSVMGLDAGVDD